MWSLISTLAWGQALEVPSVQAGLGLTPSGQAVFDAGLGLGLSWGPGEAWTAALHGAALRDGVWEEVDGGALPVCRPGVSFLREEDLQGRVDATLRRNFSEVSVEAGYTGQVSTQQSAACREEAPGWAYEGSFRGRFRSGAHGAVFWRKEVLSGRALGWATWQGEQLTPETIRMNDGEIQEYRQELQQASSAAWGSDLLLLARLGPLQVLPQLGLSRYQQRQRSWSSAGSMDFVWEQTATWSGAQALEVAVPVMDDLLAVRVWERASLLPGQVVVPAFGAGLRWGAPLEVAPVLSGR
jgi:hypothetical protein